MKNTQATSIDEYIAGSPKEVQKSLKEIRDAVKKAVPKAEEAIKYAMPTFVLNGNLIHFAAFKNHIGIYPVPRGVDGFKKELDAYDGEKNTLKIPLDAPPPLTLITKIVKYNVKRNQEKQKMKNA